MWLKIAEDSFAVLCFLMSSTERLGDLATNYWEGELSDSQGFLTNPLYCVESHCIQVQHLWSDGFQCVHAYAYTRLKYLVVFPKILLIPVSDVQFDVTTRPSSEYLKVVSY